MAISRALLLKCLGGVAACTGVAGVGILGSQSGLGGTSSSEETNNSSEEAITTELGTLLEKVGLTTCTSTESGSNECDIGTTGLKVKQENNSEENKTKDTTSSTGKIKVYSDSSYENNFKFVIEEGDINLSGSGSISKLEQFETYEIKKEESQDLWYFSRKDKSGKKIKELLGLPEGCSLPDNGTSTYDIESEKINEINFEDKGNAATVTGTVTLTITKLTTPEEDFPFDYKFSFKGKAGEVNLTINGNTIKIKQNEGTEFRIKKGETENSLTLEEAWSLNRLLEKVGLSECTTENGTECTISNVGLKVKQEGESGEEGKTKDTTNGGSTGKIKVSKESTNTTYNKGFKFVIEEGDIKLTGGTGSTNTITKLEQFETYEIKKESNNKWYFSRKDKAGKGIKTALGLPESCTLPETSSTSPSTPTCTISTNNISTIKFDGGNPNPSINGNATLTITKLTTTDPEFPFDYKFGFKASSGSTATLTINSKAISLKSNEDTEFKIKKGTSGNSLTLEQVWTLETLAKKVNLTCTNNTCTQISDQTTNIKQDSSSYDNKTLSNSDSGKIKVYTGTDASGYNKDFKFVIEGADISSSDSAAKLEEFETYEIKKDSDKWYFYRKTKAEEGIKKALGLDEINDCNLPTDVNTPTTCCDLDSDKLKKIKFDGKGTTDPTIADSGKAKLTITKVSDDSKNDFPFGYKFAFESDNNITIPKNDSSTISIKKKTNTEFKIKATAAGDGSTARTLSLEKAWDIDKWGKKIGLTNCSETDGKKECDLGDNINLFISDSDKTEGATIKEECKGKKITYEEEVEGYNQGFKFTVTEEITLNSTESGEKKIENNNATYEIKEQNVSGSNKWFLSKHTANSQ